ncbi:cytoplasmic protein [Salmonella enterica subsp. enterica serovar Kentucky]|nr:cytoplasmic protein [Salmonella enterica subsp. enterica serovar Kentucky]
MITDVWKYRGKSMEVGPRGGIKDNFATIAETKPRHQRNALKATGCWQKEHLTVNVSQSIWRHDSWRRLITVRPVLYRLASIVQDAP